MSLAQSTPTLSSLAGRMSGIGPHFSYKHHNTVSPFVFQLVYMFQVTLLYIVLFIIISLVCIILCTVDDTFLLCCSLGTLQLLSDITDLSLMVEFCLYFKLQLASFIYNCNNILKCCQNGTRSRCRGGMKVSSVVPILSCRFQGDPSLHVVVAGLPGRPA